MATMNEERDGDQDGGGGGAPERDPCVDVASIRETSEVEGYRGNARMPGRGRSDAVAAAA